MKLCRVCITVGSPPIPEPSGVAELQIEVWTDAQKYKLTECLLEDHFDSLFDRVIERAVEKLKEGIRKEESLTESKS